MTADLRVSISDNFAGAQRPRYIAGISAAAVTALIALSACTTKPELPPLPPEASLCTFYTPWQMSAQPAALETVDKLRTHAGNNAAHYDKCIADNPKLDPKRSGGPR